MIRAGTFRLFVCAMALALAAPLAAPVAAQDDVRLQTRIYDEGSVFTIPGKVKVQTTIKFRADEAIENVAIGDSQAWQVQPNKAQSLLFVKPLEPNAKTNMTVVTNKRTYLFDLVASPRNTPLYVMKFRYPEAEKAEEEARMAAAAAAAVKAREGATPLELAAANDPYAVLDPDTLNYEWASEGDRNLIPSSAYDNGDAVFLTWPAGTPLPAILVTNEEGEEGPVNFTVRGDTVVLDTVPAKIILRSGDNTATLINNGPVPANSRSVHAPTNRSHAS